MLACAGYSPSTIILYIMKMTTKFHVGIYKETKMTIIITEHPTGEVHSINTEEIRTLTAKRKTHDSYNIEIENKKGEFENFETKCISGVKALLSGICGTETLVQVA